MAINPKLVRFVCKDALIHPIFSIADRQDFSDGVINAHFEYQTELVEKFANLQQWRTYLSCHNWIERPAALVRQMNQIHPSEFFVLVGEIWNSGYCTSCFLDSCLSRSKLDSQRVKLMTSQEHAYFEEAADWLTLYRAHDAHNLFGLSWTSKRETALNFGRCFRSSKLTTIKVEKRFAVAFFDRKLEFEWIVEPSSIIDQDLETTTVDFDEFV